MLIASKSVFELVKSGEWTLSDFMIWMEKYRSAAWECGLEDGIDQERDAHDAEYH